RRRWDRRRSRRHAMIARRRPNCGGSCRPQDRLSLRESAPLFRGAKGDTPVRGAYTLLEMTLALAIALVILRPGYAFLNQQLRLMEVGRDLAEETALARRILDRMAADINSSLGGVDPQQLPSVSSDATEALLQAETFTPLFNYGLEGNDGLLIIYASRVPRELVAPDKRSGDPS